MNQNVFLGNDLGLSSASLSAIKKRGQQKTGLSPAEEKPVPFSVGNAFDFRTRGLAEFFQGNAAASV